MQIEYIPISSIHPYEKNPRCNGHAIEEVAKSIKAYGFKVPIIIDKHGVIIAGHTRYAAAQKLNMDKIPCIIADDLSDAQAKAFRIADNKTSDYSIWDNTLLLQELNEISDLHLDDLYTGYPIVEFDSILEETKDELEKQENGITFEITFKSKDEWKILSIQQAWEGIEKQDEA